MITGVRGAGHLVYLAAFVPDSGESAANPGGASPQLQDAIKPEPDGSTSLHPDRAAETLYGGCPGPLAAWAVGLLRAQAPGCGRGVPEHHSWKRTSSTYVVCAQDRAIDPVRQRKMASRCTGVREWQTGHSPFVGQPDLVVGLLQELLAATTLRRPDEGVTRCVRTGGLQLNNEVLADLGILDLPPAGAEVLLLKDLRDDHHAVPDPGWKAYGG